MAGRLDGKTALVSGVSDGMGGAIARLFAKEGSRVACTGIEAELIDETVAAIRESGGEAIALALDVTSDADWGNAIARTIENFGGLDILVNNAGVLLLAPIAATTQEDFRRVLAVNAEGAFLGLRHAVLAMRPGGVAGKGGSIINISSVAASKAATDHVAYGASKAAVSAMTRHAACECAEEGIRINAICPGVVRTRMFVDSTENLEQCTRSHPLGLGKPEDVAAAALYLASDEARWVTGAEFTVDGGLSVHP